MRRAARALLPKAIRNGLRGLRRVHRRLRLERAIRGVSKLPQRATLPPGLVRDFIYGWGNSWSANEEYLAAMLSHAWDRDGPILECGSGLTSLLLGIVSQHTGHGVWSLEHDPFWANRTRAALERYRLRRVQVCFSELTDYGSYWWYRPPEDRLPNHFSLVVCDGPPEGTPGGRYGLLPIMRPYLKTGCIILLDDASRPGEAAVLKRWASELGTSYSLVETAKSAYSRLTVP